MDPRQGVREWGMGIERAGGPSMDQGCSLLIGGSTHFMVDAQEGMEAFRREWG